MKRPPFCVFLSTGDDAELIALAAGGSQATEHGLLHDDILFDLRLRLLNYDISVGCTDENLGQISDLGSEDLEISHDVNVRATKSLMRSAAMIEVVSAVTCIQGIISSKSIDCIGFRSTHIVDRCDFNQVGATGIQISGRDDKTLRADMILRPFNPLRMRFNSRTVNPPASGVPAARIDVSLSVELRGHENDELAGAKAGSRTSISSL